MPYVTNRWLGGMMTNFATIKKSIKKMKHIERMLKDGSLESVTKKERLTLTRELAKLDRTLGGIADVTRIPPAIFIIDIDHEHIAVAEAHKLGMRTFGVVDTNSDPNKVDFPMPGSPPIKVTEPCTNPPPSTRSSSERPVVVRGTFFRSISLSDLTCVTCPE